MKEGRSNHEELIDKLIDKYIDFLEDERRNYDLSFLIMFGGIEKYFIQMLGLFINNLDEGYILIPEVKQFKCNFDGILFSKEIINEKEVCIENEHILGLFESKIFGIRNKLNKYPKDYGKIEDVLFKTKKNNLKNEINKRIKLLKKEEIYLPIHGLIFITDYYMKNGYGEHRKFEGIIKKNWKLFNNNNWSVEKKTIKEFYFYDVLKGRKANINGKEFETHLYVAHWVFKGKMKAK